MNREAPVTAKSDSHTKAIKRTGFKVLKMNIFRHHFIMCIMEYSQGDISFLSRQHLVVMNFIFYLLFLPWTPVCLPRIPSLLCQLGLIDSFPQLLEILMCFNLIFLVSEMCMFATRTCCFDIGLHYGMFKSD